MSQDYFYLHISKKRSGIEYPFFPVGFLKMSTCIPKTAKYPNTLVGLRSECLRRGYMHENDEFLVSPTSCGTAMFPVAFTDEARISIEEYLMGHNNVYIRNKEIENPASSPGPQKEGSTPDDTQSTSSTLTDLRPVILASYVLHCWSSQVVSPTTKTRGNFGTSHTVTPLPDYFLAVDATFTAFARAAGDGSPARVVFSVESPFQAKSLFYIGTYEKSCKIEYYSLPGKTARIVLDVIAKDAWTHLALVWKPASRELVFYVNGHLAKQEVLACRDGCEYLSDLKSTHFVLGRSKKDGIQDSGWDGFITDARVYGRALEEPQISELAAQMPKSIETN